MHLPRIEHSNFLIVLLVVEFGIEHWHELAAGSGTVALFDYPGKKVTEHA